MAIQFHIIVFCLAVHGSVARNVSDVPGLPSTFYPAGTQHGDTFVTPGDETSSVEVESTAFFKYYNVFHSSFWVNTNGQISFLGPISSYSDAQFPVSSNQRLVAPFYSDVDTSTSGLVYYRESRDGVLLNRASTDIRTYYNIQFPRFTATWIFIATWHNVSSSNPVSTIPTNTFQAVLVTDGRYSFSLFNYDNLDWVQGGRMTKPAQVGYNAGDGVRSYSFPGSQTVDIKDLNTTSNVGVPGRWVFRLDQNEVVTGGCTGRSCGAADIVFVIDSSGSIGINNFVTIRNFIEDIVDGLNIGANADDVRVAAVQFTSQVHPEWNLDRYTSKSALKSVIQNLPYYGGGTRLFEGLNYARTNILTTANGDRASARNILIVISDGQSAETLWVAESTLIRQTATIFAVGIGGLDAQTLQTLAGSFSNYVRVDDFNALKTTLSTLISTSCVNAQLAELNVRPRSSTILGGTAITLAGPCLDSTDTIRCTFGSGAAAVSVSGSFAGEMLGICIAPQYLTRGKTDINVYVNNVPTHVGAFWYVLADTDQESVTRANLTDWETVDGSKLITWSTGVLVSYAVDISYYTWWEDQGNTVTYSTVIGQNVRNVGSYELPSNLTNAKDITAGFYGAIKVTQSTTPTRALWTPIHNSTYFVQLAITEAAIRLNTSAVIQDKIDLIGLSDTANSSKTYLVQNLTALVEEYINSTLQEDDPAVNQLLRRKRQVGLITGFLVGRVASYLVKNAVEYLVDISSSNMCDWYLEREAANPTNFTGLQPPPCTETQARRDSRFRADTACFNGAGLCDFFHKGAHSCYRSAEPSWSGAGQQVCYNAAGRILPFNQGGGTVDRTHSSDWFGHFRDDVLPFIVCCKTSDSCKKYEQLRPTQDCLQYVPQRAAFTFGDPSMVTLDGLEYTFNAIGEFWLCKPVTLDFKMQGRMIQAVNASNFPVVGAVWQAFAMKSGISSTVMVELRVEGDYLEVTVDGNVQDFSTLTSQSFTGLDIKVDASSVTVFFKDSPYVEIKKANRALSYVLSLPNKYKGQTVGLLGDYDGDKSNDLKPSSGSALTQPASMEDIHNKFGTTWEISQGESLFTYRTGTSYYTYRNPSFTPTFITDFTLDSAAVSLCSSNLQCYFDYFVTRDPVFAQGTLGLYQTAQAILQDLAPVVTCNFDRVGPVNGSIYYEGNLVGDVSYPVCDPGYSISGLENSTCLSTTLWSTSDDGTCHPGDCNLIICKANQVCKLVNGLAECRDSNGGLEVWVIAVIIAGAALVTLVVVCVLVWKCCCGGNNKGHVTVAPASNAVTVSATTSTVTASVVTSTTATTVSSPGAGAASAEAQKVPATKSQKSPYNAPPAPAPAMPGAPSQTALYDRQ